MSASTVSVTANATSTRRRAVEKKQPTGGLELAADSTYIVATAASPTTPDTNTNNSSARLTAGGTTAAIHKDVIHVRKPPPNTTSGDPATARRTGASRKSSKVEKPRWLTVMSIITKNFALLLVLLLFVQMIRWAVLNSGHDTDDFSGISGDFDGKFAEMDKFVKKSLNAMQVQVEAIDRKYEKGISSIKNEFDEKLDNQGKKVDLKLKELDGRSELFEKFMGEFESKSLLSKEEFSDFFEEFRKSKKNGAGQGDEVSLDEIRNYARNILEKEIQRHAADGLGMVDYALASGGGMVVRHSEPYRKLTGSRGWLTNRNTVHVDAEKMLRPSFGEPGQCFPLKGSSGFVQIRLRAAILPEAVTLEHVAKSVAYNRSSAPKNCRVSGWLQGRDLTNLVIDTEKMFLLTEFTYDLDKSSAQTFDVLESAASTVVDTIRLDFTSNHGSDSHTCIYRLRVHGHEPDSISMMATQS
ncbi:Protein SAD1/UNC-84 domain protein 1 [Forsythia ovata]|uniref:Protein SAD1/UNC-84 domain protein 1 n=1 Tax=Forsythia ovata TaxID=205694 RepID=A0ABD1QPK5_9LAMI